MSTTSLDYGEMTDLQPSAEMWSLYNPTVAPHRFQAEDRSAAEMWQTKTHEALVNTIGFQTESSAPTVAQHLETVDRGDYIREKLLMRTSEHSLMPFYLLLPKAVPQPYPVVLAFHGHGYGVKDIVGLWEDGTERDTPDGYHKDFAIALCRRGFAVAAPEIACFGERQSDFSYLNVTLGQPVPDTCAHTAMLAFHHGGSVVGLRVRDGRRLVDYLESRNELDLTRLGAMGISGGGMHTFFSTCVDERIKACVVSGYYSTFRDSILAMHHCACNFVPGLHRFGEMYDLVGLIAPRPFLVEAGNRDPIFPLDAVKYSVERAREVYGVFGAEGQIETDYFEGRHQISGRRAYDFLMERLIA
ncbi:MAG: acetylxylan esterase [Chloroflexi bacterium]|nr:acetylxylan esterase [Chloroflexota bacterium]